MQTSQGLKKGWFQVTKIVHSIVRTTNSGANNLYIEFGTLDKSFDEINSVVTWRIS